MSAPDVYALLLELVATLDHNPDDLVVTIGRDAAGAWTAEVVDAAGATTVAGATATGDSGTAAIDNLVGLLADKLDARRASDERLRERARSWMRGDS